MQDLPLVQIEEGEGHLCKPVHDLLLSEIFSLASIGLDLGVDITAIAVDHDNIQKLFAVNVRILVRHDVCMADLL